VKSSRVAKWKWPKVVLVVLGCLGLAAPALAQVSSNYDLSWHVIAGGGEQMNSTGRTMVGTIGQPLVGAMAAGGGHSLCSGFWCRGEVEYKVYLPLVLR